MLGPVQRVFITENETNFLAFPPACNAIVIFGAGYGWDALSRSRWLNNCSIHYWGDIDTHGFGILDQLRGHFDHVVSFLMDRATLDAHAVFWGSEGKLRIPRHPATQSTLIWPGIPRPSGHLFHGHPAGQSERSDAGVALLV